MFLLLTGCYGVQPSQGGGQTGFVPPRTVNAADVALPPGYRIEAVATGLTFPTGAAVDREGRVHVTESGYSYGEAWTTPRLLRVEADGRTTEIAAGGRNGPWNGVDYRDGAFYVAEGGQLEGGRILRITPDGAMRALVEDLPSLGDHHTNGPAAAPDGWIYFNQGTATNSAVVGKDNADFGWLKRFPKFSDAPCRDVRLTGANFRSEDPIAGRGEAVTGAYMPFGTPTQPGQVVPGRVPCNGAVMRVRAEGGPVELVAWGLRNPFGIAFAPDGRLFVTENSYDSRGSRPVFGTGDLLWEVRPGAWYGWPDFHGEHALDQRRFAPVAGPIPPRLIADHPNAPQRPAAIFGVHSSANGLDFSRSPGFGHVGQAFVAQFGDMAPNTGKVIGPVGFKVVRVDPASGVIHDFAVNRGTLNGPASRIGGGGLERPVAVRFDPSGAALYIVDFGVMTMGPRGPEPRQGTGVLWRVTRTGG